jgi:hypothetical protein
MTADGRAGDALFRDPLPDGFARRVHRALPGRDVALEPAPPADAIVVVEQGELELECRAGTCRCFGRGSMIPIARLPMARLLSVGSRPLVLAVIARASDEFPRTAGSHDDG